MTAAVDSGRPPRDPLGAIFVQHIAAPLQHTRTAKRSSSPRGWGRANTRAAVEVIRPGDCVFFEPGENHWHGAAPNRFMVYIAMQQNDESGSPVTWGEHVTDEQYGASPTSAD
jgi:hypothetical protein